MRRRRPAPDIVESKNLATDSLNSPINARSKNPFKVVVSTKKRENPQLRKQLIELTERLATEAKNGALKGLGGFADYGDQYTVGLEGSYLEYPHAAVLPIILLEDRVIADVKKVDCME